MSRYFLLRWSDPSFCGQEPKEELEALLTRAYWLKDRLQNKAEDLRYGPSSVERHICYLKLFMTITKSSERGVYIDAQIFKKYNR